MISRLPMAISLAFGVIFATFITLMLIPCGYLVLDDIAGSIRRRRKRRSEQSAQEAA